MLNWDVSGLIIEGICGTGKTTAVRALISNDLFVHRAYPSAIILSEHHTLRVLERKQAGEGLLPVDSLELLNSHVQFIEAIHYQAERMDWNARNRINHRIAYLFERFHFSHVFHYGLRWEDVRPIDERLAQLNCKLCMLEMDEQDLEARIIIDRQARIAGWSTYIQRFGTSNSEIVAYYKRQQDFAQDLLQKTQLPWVKINTSRLSVDDIVKQLIPFWGV